MRDADRTWTTPSAGDAWNSRSSRNPSSVRATTCKHLSVATTTSVRGISATTRCRRRRRSAGSPDTGNGRIRWIHHVPPLLSTRFGRNRRMGRLACPVSRGPFKPPAFRPSVTRALGRRDAQRFRPERLSTRIAGRRRPRARPLQPGATWLGRGTEEIVYAWRSEPGFGTVYWRWSEIVAAGPRLGQSAMGARCFVPWHSHSPSSVRLPVATERGVKRMCQSSTARASRSSPAPRWPRVHGVPLATSRLWPSAPSRARTPTCSIRFATPPASRTGRWRLWMVAAGRSACLPAPASTVCRWEEPARVPANSAGHGFSG